MGWGCRSTPTPANGHAWRIKEDYEALAALGLRTVRECIGWRLFAQQGSSGLQRLYAQALLAAEQGIQVIRTLMHYRWPAALDPKKRQMLSSTHSLARYRSGRGVGPSAPNNRRPGPGP